MVRHIEGRFNVANSFTKYEVLNDYLMHSHYFLTWRVNRHIWALAPLRCCLKGDTCGVTG